MFLAPVITMTYWQIVTVAAYNLTKNKFTNIKMTKIESHSDYRYSYCDGWRLDQINHG